MKRALYFGKFFSFYILICYIISSCSSSQGVYTEGKKPGKGVIRITGSDPATNVLTLRDSLGNSADTFRATYGQRIKWKIEDPKVKSISMISEKETSHNVFGRRPHKAFLSKNWKGRIKKTEKEDEEFYYIEWNEKKGASHKFDPFIQVRPRS